MGYALRGSGLRFLISPNQPLALRTHKYKERRISIRCLASVAASSDHSSQPRSDLLALTIEVKMAGGKIAHATLKGPSVVKEICMGIVLGMAAGGLWKMHHWNEQRKMRAFYDLLEKDEISVVAEE